MKRVAISPALLNFSLDFVSFLLEIICYASQGSSAISFTVHCLIRTSKVTKLTCDIIFAMTNLFRPIVCVLTDMKLK